MTDVDGKGEDYRKITPYWCSRLLLVEGKSKSMKWWENKFNYSGNIFTDNYKWIIENISIRNFTLKIFDLNIMTLGYPKKEDKSRIKIFEHAGIKIDYGREKWGAEKGKLYFVIKHGKRIQ